MRALPPELSLDIDLSTTSLLLIGSHRPLERWQLAAKSRKDDPLLSQ